MSPHLSQLFFTGKSAQESLQFRPRIGLRRAWLPGPIRWRFRLWWLNSALGLDDPEDHDHDRDEHPNDVAEPNARNR